MVTNAKHRELIETFLAGEIGLDDLTRQLQDALAVSPDMAADHRAHLDELRMAGRLPPQLHAMLWDIQPAANPSVGEPDAKEIQTPLPSSKDRGRKSKEAAPSPLEQLFEGAMPARTIIPGFSTGEAGAAPNANPATNPNPSPDLDRVSGQTTPPDIYPTPSANVSAEEPIGYAEPARIAAAPPPPPPPIAKDSFAPVPSPDAYTPAEPPVVETAEPFAEAPSLAPETPPAGSAAPLAPYRNSEANGADATLLLPDDFDPMEGLPASAPASQFQQPPPDDSTPTATPGTAGEADAASIPVVEEDDEDTATDPTREKRPKSGPLPSSLLPESELEADSLPPEAYPKPRSSIGGGMPLPTPAKTEDDSQSADGGGRGNGSANDASMGDGAHASIGSDDDPANETEARVDEAIFAKYLSTYKNLRDQRQNETDHGDAQRLDALLQPWQTIRFRRDAAKLAEGDTSAVGEFGLEDEDGPADVGPGDIVNKRFVIERILGEGGMGTVYKAVDRRQLEAKSRNPFVALKLLSHDFRRHPEAFRALERETRKAQILAHPNIVTVFDFDRDGRVAYMTMELLEGSPLSRMISSHGDAVSWEIALPIVTGVGAALSYAHEQGIVHADIKPGNIFFTNDGRAKLLDFGIAQAFRESYQSASAGITADDGLAGALTPGFASVEMLENMPAAPKDDIYAFACVIYEMLAGRHPFDGKTASEAEANGETPQPIDGLTRKQNAALAHGLAFRRESRPDTMQTFIEELVGEKRGWFGR